MGAFGQVLLVTAAAGIGGTGLGGGAACLLRRDSSRMVSLLLSFAAGVMVAVVCFDLLAETAPGWLTVTALGILGGYGVTAGLNRVLEQTGPAAGRSGLLLAGVVMAAAIALHNVPEGMVIGAAFAAGEADSGWLLAAETAAWVRAGYARVLGVLPFGCLPGHIYGRGQYAALQQKLPGSRIVGVDYDAGLRDGTVESRIRMLLDMEP